MPDISPEVQRLLREQGLAAVDDFVILTRRPSVSFKAQDVEPPSPQLLDLDDTIVVSLYSTSAQPTVRVAMRILRPDGSLFWTRDDVTTVGQTFTTQFTKQVNEGYLLSVAVSVSGLTVTRGDIYCRVEIDRAGEAALVPYAQLCAGYIESGTDVSWPTGGVSSPLEGSGKILVNTPANPAAGTEVSIAQTGGTRWALRSLTFAFTTSAAVATRFVRLLLKQGANVVWASTPPSAGQAASTALTYVYSVGTQIAQAGPAGGQITTSPLPDPFTMAKGFTIATSAQGLDAADTYSSIVYEVEQWIAPDM